MYPVAWAVVEKENEETWSWFFEKLFEDLNIVCGLGWTFMSDKQKVNCYCLFIFLATIIYLTFNFLCI